MTPTEYPISTVADFAKVPDERLEDCLREFVSLIVSHRVNLQRPDFDLRLESWTWIDDSIPAIREVHLMVEDRVENIPNPRFPEWVRVSDRKRRPPIDKVVRVLWTPTSKTDQKTAVWDGTYWWTPRRAGIYDEEPSHWLFVPPLPPPPTA